MCRNYYPALEYCSLHTVLPSGRVDVMSAVKEAINDKSNKGECLKWHNSEQEDGKDMKVDTLHYLNGQGQITRIVIKHYVSGGNSR
jgi:hypothetical protein